MVDDTGCPVGPEPSDWSKPGDAGQAGVDGHGDPELAGRAPEAPAVAQMEVEDAARGRPTRSGTGARGSAVPTGAAGGRSRTGARRPVARRRHDGRPARHRWRPPERPVDRHDAGSPAGACRTPAGGAGPPPAGPVPPGSLPPGQVLARCRSTSNRSLRQPHYPRLRVPRAPAAPGRRHRRARPTASGRRGTPSIWWVDRCATPSWPTATPVPTGRRPTRPRPGLHHRRPPRRHRGRAAWVGRRRVDPGQAVRHHRLPPGDQKYEITTHRAEAYQPDSRKPEVAFGDRIEDDLARRDFTVNAMALRLPELELIDPFGGLVDLAERRLRTPLDPEVSFADDPLRMLRAARFMAKLDLEPTEELVAAVRAATAGCPSCRPNASATSWTRSWWSRSRRPPCGSSSGPAWPTSSCPSSPAWPWSRTRSTGTRTCWATPWRWWTRRPRTGCSGWPRSSTTWANPAPGPSSTAG